jgi:hypothetical protein
VKHVLLWVRALITGSVGAFQRRYFVDVYHGRSETIEINLDASPWGIGGYVVIGNKISHWFASAISNAEAKVLSMVIGEAAGQQTAEALAALVALRTWHCLWKERPLTLRVRSDSISALVLVLKLKTSGIGSTVVAREIALDVARACYEPIVVEHVPGVSNKICDHLSRKFQPGVSFTLPAALVRAEETVIKPRDERYFEAIALPPDAAHQKRE